MGIARLATELVTNAERMKVSENSVAKMKKFGGPKYLPRLIVEAATVSAVGRPFVVACYGVEGEDPLVFSVWMAFRALASFRKKELPVGPETKIGKRCKEAADLVSKELSRLGKKVDNAKRALENKEGELETLKWELDDLDGKHDAAPAQQGLYLDFLDCCICELSFSPKMFRTTSPSYSPSPKSLSCRGRGRS